MSLPPGPRIPKAAQTAQLARDAIGYMRRCRTRYGDLFTLRYHPFDTLVYVCDPEAVREIFTGDPGGLAPARRTSSWSRSSGRARSCCSTAATTSACAS